MDCSGSALILREGYVLQAGPMVQTPAVITGLSRMFQAIRDNMTGAGVVNARDSSGLVGRKMPDIVPLGEAIHEVAAQTTRS